MGTFFGHAVRAMQRDGCGQGEGHEDTFRASSPRDDGERVGSAFHRVGDLFALDWRMALMSFATLAVGLVVMTVGMRDCAA